MHLLALDIGNSGLHLGALCDHRLRWHARLAGGRAERVGSWLRMVLERQGEPVPGWAVFSTVVPALEAPARRALQEVAGRVLQVRGDSPVGLVNGYRDPASLGADRLAAAVGAYRLVGGPVIVADIGTAITVDAVSAAGEFLGGAILPGPRTGLQALQGATARLQAPRRLRPALPGRSTEECLAAGARWGPLGAIRELAARLRRVVGAQAPLVLAGGAARELARQLPEARLEPHLVLLGLAYCLDALAPDAR